MTGRLEALQALAPDGWTVEWEHGGDYAQHKGGISWHDAPLPPWRHRCSPQTEGWIVMDHFLRCACGATRFNGSDWLHKNETRIGRGESRPRWWQR